MNQVPRNIWDTLVMIDSLVRSKVDNINLVLPYFAFSRGDKINGRESMTASLLTRLYIAAGADEVITMDLHADQVRGIGDPKLMANENLYMLPLLVEYIFDNILPCLPKGQKLYIVPPDVGAGKLGERYAELLKAEIRFAYKRRSQETGKVEVVEKMELLGDVKGAYVITVDDETQKGTTLLKLLGLLQENGADKVSIFISHGKLTGIAEKEFSRWYADGEGLLDRMVIGDNIKHSYDFYRRNPWLHTVDTTGLMAEAIYTVHCGTSIQKMYTTQINHSLGNCS